MKRLTQLIPVVVLLVLSLASGVFAQTQITTGVIQGTVTDEQGGVVPGATVEVKSPDTNFSKSLTTNSDGRFVFLQLQPGRYVLTTSKQGFASVVRENHASVGQTINLSLSIEVLAAGKILHNRGSTIDTVKTESSSL
jgi:hypothetical protein